jgi:hypothetical protein
MAQMGGAAFGLGLLLNEGITARSLVVAAAATALTLVSLIVFPRRKAASR